MHQRPSRLVFAPTVLFQTNVFGKSSRAEALIKDAYFVLLSNQIIERTRVTKQELVESFRFSLFREIERASATAKSIRMLFWNYMDPKPSEAIEAKNTDREIHMFDASFLDGIAIPSDMFWGPTRSEPQIPAPRKSRCWKFA